MKIDINNLDLDDLNELPIKEKLKKKKKIKTSTADDVEKDLGETQ